MLQPDPQLDQALDNGTGLVSAKAAEERRPSYTAAISRPFPKVGCCYLIQSRPLAEVAGEAARGLTRALGTPCALISATTYLAQPIANGFASTTRTNPAPRTISVIQVATSRCLSETSRRHVVGPGTRHIDDDVDPCKPPSVPSCTFASCSPRLVLCAPLLIYVANSRLVTWPVPPNCPMSNQAAAFLLFSSVRMKQQRAMAISSTQASAASRPILPGPFDLGRSTVRHATYPAATIARSPRDITPIANSIALQVPTLFL